MHTERWLVLFRVFLSTVVLLALLWLALSGWPSAARPNAAPGATDRLPEGAGEITPLLWRDAAQRPRACERLIA